eukprot:jgi/Mesvir1/2088/Mv16620-RA.1
MADTPAPTGVNHQPATPEIDLRAINYNWTELSKASFRGDQEKVLEFLRAGEDPNHRDEWWKSPLHYASEKGQTEVCRLLINYKANVMYSDKEQRIPLHYAAMGGHFDTVKLLVEKGSSVNIKDKMWCTPIHRAADRGHTEIVQYCLQQKYATIDVTDKNGWTPIHWASFNGHLATAKALVELGADKLLRVKSKHKMTPVDLAKDDEMRTYLTSKLIKINTAPHLDESTLPPNIKVRWP